MTSKTGIMRFARNEKGGKNGQKLFCPFTKPSRKRARTIMAVRSKNWPNIIISKKIA
jgi:hypothetical protein